MTTHIHTALKVTANIPLPFASQAATLADAIISQVDQATYNEEYLEYFKERIKRHQANLKNYSQNSDNTDDETYKNYVRVLKKILEYVKEVKKPGSFSDRFLKFFHNVINANEVKFEISDS